MTTCAVCNISDDLVVNVIQAEPTDPPYEGTYLAEINATTNVGGIGYIYNREKNKFISPQLFPSWTLDPDTCLWTAPIPQPLDGYNYWWNEDTQTWIRLDG